MLFSLRQARLLSSIFQEERTFLLEEFWLRFIIAPPKGLLQLLMKAEENRGHKNWQKLKNIVHSGTLAVKEHQPKLKLFERLTEHHPDHLLTTLSLPTTTTTLYQKSPLPIYKELLHFEGEVDATGRWVWEAEEAAAYFFLQTGEAIISEVLKRAGENRGDLRILELGAGSSGIAGLALWQVASRLTDVQPRLQLADGQANNIQFLQENLTLNKIPCESSSAKSLIWGDADTISNQSRPQLQRLIFDIIIICDCLYFQTLHKQLLLTIDSYLSTKGSVFLVNPARGHSMAAFLALAADRGFEFEQVTFEDAKYEMQCKKAQTEPGFDKDKHCLFFIKLCRK